ncbi:MAG: precorrin-6A reductase [Enterocloster sp.]
MKEDRKTGGRIVMFAGTTEGRILAGWLAGAGLCGVICTATEYGGELLEKEIEGSGFALREGRMDEKQMEELFEKEQPSLVIDATHPYAAEVTSNIRKACGRKGLRLLRCLREEAVRGEYGRDVLFVSDAEEGARLLEKTEGNIFLTTGAKELAPFCRREDMRKRIVARVLPVEESVRSCRNLGLDGRQIIGMQGPFSAGLNAALLTEFNCRYLVTKDGGKAGGLPEKLEAARRCKAAAVVIRRPRDEGSSLEEVIKQVKEWMDHG